MRFRLLVPSTSTSNAVAAPPVFIVSGHNFQQEPYIEDSTMIGFNPLSETHGAVRGGVGDKFDLLFQSAGGHGKVAGDGVWEGRIYPDLFTPSGVVLMRRDGRELVDAWAKWDCHPEPLYAHQPGEWFWDQCILLHAVEESRVSCAAIPYDRFCCNHFSGKAAIWSAHGGWKQRNYEYFVVEHEVQRVLRSHPLLVRKRS